MAKEARKVEGLRERKKKETLQRIAGTGLRLFVEKGFEATTLDEIASQSGIARRTFFYYFKSKEDILMTFLEGSYGKGLGPLLLAQSTEKGPFLAVRDALLQLVSSHETAQAIMVDSLLSSTDALKARMQTAYIEMEQSTFEALCELWPQPERRPGLRMVAMAAIGAMRVAKQTWRKEGGRMALSNYVEESFATLENSI